MQLPDTPGMFHTHGPFLTCIDFWATRMIVAIIGFLAVASWIATELTTSWRSVRIAVGFVAMVLVGVITFGACSMGSQFNITFQTNTTTKNLTSGLVEITSGAIDIDEFRYRIRELDSRVKPTYEDHHSARLAITEFLSAYGIEYRNVIPLQSNRTPPP
jgi:hypothetical protein